MTSAATTSAMDSGRAVDLGLPMQPNELLVAVDKISLSSYETDISTCRPANGRSESDSRPQCLNTDFGTSDDFEHHENNKNNQCIVKKLGGGHFNGSTRRPTLNYREKAMLDNREAEKVTHRVSTGPLNNVWATALRLVCAPTSKAINTTIFSYANTQQCIIIHENPH